MSKLEIENLRAILNNAQKSGNTQEIIDCYNALGEEYRKRGDNDSLMNAIKYHKMETRECEEHDMIDASASAYRYLGDSYRDIGDIANAKKCYHTALALMRGNLEHVSECEKKHACSSDAIHEENVFLQSCQNEAKLLEYYRSLCNLGISYLNEVGFLPGE